MFKKLWGSEWTGAVGAVVSCIWEAFLLIGPPIGIGRQEQRSYLVWGGIALVLCSAQSFSVLRRKNRDLGRQLSEINEAKPRIKPKEPAVHCKMVFHAFKDGNGVTVFGAEVPFLRIGFHNDPPKPFPSSIAKNVRAYVDFFPKGEIVPTLQIDGRWSESSQPPAYSEFESKASLLETSFGFGESRTVDIAYISGTDKKCYAWNNDNYAHFNEQYVTPEHLLSADNYEVRVRLRGEFVDETFKFTFNVKNEVFEFTQPS
ncbi:MAG TPA: hypothetical protein VMF66_21175 [Candidatus Acidoferrum sp.]|nr:hypothetical protein [Candidatus Acidoferrum sp.]